MKTILPDSADTNREARSGESPMVGIPQTDERQPPTKALSVQQPWASLLAYGIKDVENRTWRTSFRGPLAIHASKTFDRDALRDRRVASVLDVMQDDFPLGVVVGVVDVVGCCRVAPGCCTSEWANRDAEGHIHAARALLLGERPAARGQLGFWTLPSDVYDAVARQVEVTR